MSAACSTSTGKTYGVARVCTVWGIPRSTFYERRQAEHREPKKRGPKTALGDARLVEEIRKVIDSTEDELGFHGEGYRKVWARLRAKGIRASPKRVLRLMGLHGLLAPTRAGRPRGPKVHDGTLVTERPDEMWGTDATSTWTREDGEVTVFVAVDHCSGECVGIHAAKFANRFEALEVIRQGVVHSFGAVAAGAAEGLKLRHDHGSQFTSRDYQAELRFLGIESSPSFVRQPEGNGVAERFIRTLKEQCLWLETYRDTEELLAALHDFRRRYNETWILGRNGYVSPAEARRRHLPAADREAA